MGTIVPGRRRAARFCLAILIFAVGAGSWTALVGRAAGVPVELSAKEFLFEPKQASAPPGPVRFVVRNVGAIEHNFVLEDLAGKKVAEIAVIEPGTTAQVTASVSPGAYIIACTLPGHRQAGMVATLRVANPD